MGVEYSHFLYTNDDKWLPTIETLPRILKVLEKWNLAQNDPEFYQVINGKKVSVELPHDPENGLALVVDDIEGKPAADLMGKSFYKDIDQEDRYIESIRILVGSDFRIQQSGEEFNITILLPPMDKGDILTPYCDEDLALFMHAEAYRCSANAIAPKLDIEFNNVLYKDPEFKGYWRGAVKIYCGKDLPAFAEHYPQRMTNLEFVKDLETAFGCRLGQIGMMG